METETEINVMQVAEPKPHQHSMPERFLRQLWLRKEYNESQLATQDNKKVTIMDIGEVNTDGGPDFKNARVRIGTMQFSGDIELHQFTEDWNKHGHDRDERFNSVVLHVALWGNSSTKLETQSGRAVQTVLLHKILSHKLPEAVSRAVRYDELWRSAPLPCASMNHLSEDQTKKDFVLHLAEMRFTRKERIFKERLNALTAIDLSASTDIKNWEQLLYEGIFDALGYSKNREPFRAIANALPIQNLRTLAPTAEHLQAALFGVSGLLNDVKVSDTETGAFTAELQSLWNSIKVEYTGPHLTRTDWQWLRLRPHNFPPVRLAGAAVIAQRIANEKMFSRLVDIFSVQLPAEEQRKILHELLDTTATGYWKDYYDFGSKWTTPTLSLVGSSRVDDIIINIIIPLMSEYGTIVGNEKIKSASRELYTQYRSLSSNEVTQRMERWLFGGIKFPSAQVQQGAIELYKNYCSVERCKACAVGKEIEISIAGKK
jgi:hypothetical protein